MISNALFGWSSVVLTAIMYVPYVTSIARRKTKPHAFTWGIWMLTISIVFLGQSVSGAGPGAWATGLSAFLNGVIFIMALFLGERHITRFDTLCLVSALSAIPLWLVTNDPLYSVLLSVAIDLAGYGPTFRKSLEKPFEESISFFVVDVPACILSILAIKTFNITTLCSPVAIALANMGLIGMILWRRGRIRARIGI